MPRNGSGVYSHPFPDVVEGTTIESAVFNGNTSDVEQDLNTPRPIVAGGTGANNAHDAMIALSGEIAMQGPVTNFDTFPFVAGSFWCNAVATAAPNANAFIGTCLVHGGDPRFMTLTARDVNAAPLGPVYVREKQTGAWSAWALQPGSTADLDAAYVNVTGDNMTGALQVSTPGLAGYNWSAGGPYALQLIDTTPAGASGPQLLFGDVTFGPWAGIKGSLQNGTGPAGSLSFQTRDAVAGTPITERMAIYQSGQVNIPTGIVSTSPATGALTVAGGVGISGQLSVAGPGVFNNRLYCVNDTGITITASAGPNPNKHLRCDGAGNLQVLNSGYSSGIVTITDAGTIYASSALYAVDHIVAGSAGTTGTYYFGNTGTISLSYSGINFSLIGAAANAGAFVISPANFYLRGTDAAATGPSALFFNGSGTKYLGYDGANFNLAGGGLNISTGGSCLLTGDGTNALIRTAGAFFVQNAAGTTNYAVIQNGVATFNGAVVAQSYNAQRNDGSYGLYINAPSYRNWGFACKTNGELTIDDITGGTSRLNIPLNGYIQAGQGYNCRSGLVGPFGGNAFNMQYTGASAMQLWVDNSNLGIITVTSDYRIKKDVIDLPGMWDTVKALRPIKYTQAQYTPQIEIAHQLKLAKDAREFAEKVAKDGGEPLPAVPPPEPMFIADDVERWGFIAHELQETLVPSAATGVKDSPDHVQSPNPFTLIAALTKALQEAMARIEALEAAP